MANEAELLRDPGFQRLLSRRSRWRWCLSGFLIGAYLVWAIAGLYYPAAYATSFMGSAVPWGMLVGILIIIVSIVLSIVYVRVINRIEREEMLERDRQS
jgi:uncharacterized membrane protein (DUF485 family)